MFECIWCTGTLFYVLPFGTINDDNDDSKQDFACITMAAVHNNTTTTQVRFVLLCVASAPVLFLGNSYE